MNMYNKYINIKKTRKNKILPIFFCAPFEIIVNERQFFAWPQSSLRRVENPI